MSGRKKASRFLRTDSGNAEYFSSLYGDRVRFDHRQGRWLLWNMHEKRWIEDKQGQVQRLVKEAARYRLRIAHRSAESDERTKEIKWALKSESHYCIEKALELAKGEPPVCNKGDGWDANPWLFGAANGVIDLKTGRLREERPQDQITKHSTVRFDADAKCPRFEQFLGEVFGGDAELVGYLQRIVGYCLTGSVKEQCVFCWYGSGANGKSTLSVLLRHILGDHAVNLPFSALEMKDRNSNDLVALAGTRLATAAETNEGVRLNEARMKVLTGGDPITARRLYHESFTFDPTHKLVLAFNHKPVIADDSDGMWRRIHLIPFTRQFKPEEQDKNLLDKLKAEAPGILAWAVRGCLLWQKEGLGRPPAVAEATAAYREQSDHIGQFIADCCAVDVGATVTSAVLWERYQLWTSDNEEVSLSRQTFTDRLERRGFKRGRSHGGTRTWVRIGLRSSGARCLSDLFPDGDTVTQGDTLSDKSPKNEGIEKYSECASPNVTLSPSDSCPVGEGVC